MLPITWANFDTSSIPTVSKDSFAYAESYVEAAE